MIAHWAVENSEGLETVITEFDPYRLGRVTSVQLDFENSEKGAGTLTARFQAVYWSRSPPEMLVELTLHGVRQMTLPELGSSVFEFAELQVADVSDRGLEGIRREVMDHSSDRQFSALCRQVEVTKVLAREDGGSVSQLWPAQAAG